MNKHFGRPSFSKTILAVVLPLLCMAAAVPAFAQSAEIRSAGVYYVDNTTNINETYCNWNATTVSDLNAVSYRGGMVNVAGHQTNDPWDTSALIEYDQPYPSPTATNKYPNHCLALCFDVYCTNKPNGSTTYSISFPLQRISFEIAKYYGSKDILNPDTNPAIRTINKSILENLIVDGSDAASTAMQTALEQYQLKVAEYNDINGQYLLASGAFDTASMAYDEANIDCNKNGLTAVSSSDGTYRDIGGKDGEGECHDLYVWLNSSGEVSSRHNVLGGPDRLCPRNYDTSYTYYAPTDYGTYCVGTEATPAQKTLFAQYKDVYKDYTDAKAEKNRLEKERADKQKEVDAAKKELEKYIGATSVDLSDFMCASYTCWGTASDFRKTQTCPNPQYECAPKTELGSKGACTGGNGYCCRSLNEVTSLYTYPMSASVYGDDERMGLINGTVYCGQKSTKNCNELQDSGCVNGRETPCIIRSIGTGRGYNEPVRFCASWDGSYEILGEFGKTNGQFGFRAHVKTEYPGDGIAIENISVDDSFAYPGNNQYPIQVDVTNVHTVRTTPTVMGALTSVAAAPYTFVYRISKDSDVKILIYDASTDACTTWGTAATEAACYTANGVWMDKNGTMACCTTPKPLNVVRDLVDWKPRLGEGFKGADADGIISESDSWDGRDDSGRLLPAGNYLVSIQAKTQDEWPGTDFSRAVTRQVSLDPLKLTDITTMALNKQSTAYAQINYVPTEASRVYLEVYSPGTTFNSLYTDGSAITGTSPTVSDTNTMVRVYRTEQERARGLNYPDRWDGLCHEENGCNIFYPAGSKHPLTGAIVPAGGTTVNFAYGAPLPDGDYVYALWAEIPYVDTYTNAAGDTFTGVKTQVYYTGIMPIDRGVTDITVQPVSYSTVGSSPAAYGLDPFIFKYSTAREAVVNAYVKNTAGVTVKTLTTGDGQNNTSVAQQMNTLTWDGRDDLGRMVGPGTYMFVVDAMDPMFPNSVKTQASTIFPVDMYRLTDLTTTDVYGDTAAKATISYMLSKAMNVQINIYNKDVVIPAAPSIATGSKELVPATDFPAGGTSIVVDGKTFTNGVNISAISPATETQGAYQLTWTAVKSFADVTGTKTGVDNLAVGAVSIPVEGGKTWTNAVALNPGGSTFDVQGDSTLTWTVSAAAPYTVDLTVTSNTYTVALAITNADYAWPPRVCNKETDQKYFCKAALVSGTCTAGYNDYVNPATEPKCIYVNDPTFTDYPATPAQAVYKYAQGNSYDQSLAGGAGNQTLNARLQPIKTFNKSALNAGDGIRLTEEWDAQYFYNPHSDKGACTKATDITTCPYEMVPDGTYPFYVSAQTNEPMDIYYDLATAAPLRDAAIAQTGLYSTDKWVYRLNISRGPVYFLDGSVDVYANAPQLFNTSSGPIFVPPYEINFSISRAATVEIAIIGLKDGMCTTSRTPGASYADLPYNSVAGQVCKYLSTMTIVNTPNFDPNITRRVYWDGTDNNGKYVKNGNYEIRLTAKNYPDASLYQPTIKQVTRNIDLVKVFDLPDAEAYAINKRGTNMDISYQISVPMKVALQIFKPGTTIYDYQKGTLRDPSTGLPVQNIRDVLVRAIVGIRPATTLIDELWDGTDYAQQPVADGTYPFRFVTALDGADIDSVTGEIVGNYAETDGQDADPSLWKINKVADTNQYVNLHHATVAIGDGEFICEDWEKTVFFYPNPFVDNGKPGTLEVTKIPAPGKMSIKMYNLAGDLVREGGYTCVDAHNMAVNMGTSLDIMPDNNLKDSVDYSLLPSGTLGQPSVRNAAVRCFWDRKNDHGKKVARGVYFGLVDFRETNGRRHCQKVVRILIPK